MNGTGLIRQPSSRLAEGIVTHISRSPVDLDLALGELEQLITQPNQSSKQVVHWLNLVADLQIKYAADALAASHAARDWICSCVILSPNAVARRVCFS